LLSINNVDAQDFEWAKRIGGADDDEAHSVVVDALGNVYTTGYFQGTVDFDPGVGSSLLVSAGLYDIFISKLDASGNFVWAKRMGGLSSSSGSAITIDDWNNVYTIGYFRETVDFDPGIGVANLTSNGIGDIFISKLDASGNFVWAKEMGGAIEDYGNSIAVDASGNIYTTGSFTDTVDFDPGVGTTNFYSAGGWKDVFIQKLSQVGVGIEDVSISQSTEKIYPNPAKEEITIDLGSLKAAQISIINITGKEVYKLENVNETKTVISLSNFSKGIYFVRVQSDHQQKVMKLIKQ